jgi:hypothetical protein
MSNTKGTAHICPTRIDGEASLFAHQVTRSQCQSRQRDCFHKCFTCAHNNAYAAAQRAAQPQAVDQKIKISVR